MSVLERLNACLYRPGEHCSYTVKNVKASLYVLEILRFLSRHVSSEYVILEDFNFTRGRLYPRYKSTPARFVPEVFVKSLKCHILDDFSQVPPRPWQEFVIRGFFVVQTRSPWGGWGGGGYKIYLGVNCKACTL